MSNQDLIRKRAPVGIFSLVCLAGYLALFSYPKYQGTQAALLRVGLLLAALWLAMPTKSRAAAWKPLQSKWTIPTVVGIALLLPRLKYMLPVLAVLAGVAWFARPKRK